MKPNETIIVLDFGGQYNQLIARKVREANVYCEILPCNASTERIKQIDPQGIVVLDDQTRANAGAASTYSRRTYELGIPILHICYNTQRISMYFGGKTVGTDVKFHPEVFDTQSGNQILKNFLYEICGCSGQWTMANFAHQSIKELRIQIGDKKVLCGLSGGVDSSVAAILLHKAVGSNLICIFVDHGLLRKDEGDQVEEIFKEQFQLNLIRVNAQERFLSRLRGVSDPETKRKIIGEEFIRVFEEEAKKIGTVDYLVQGTIYSDVVESGAGDAAMIKSHHNVGGLPEHIDFKEIIEPLKYLFKDEVRKLGEELGIPKGLVWRQPFPGPGLAIRIIGDITEEKLEILREADAVFRYEIAKADLDREIWQYFAVLTDMRSVGIAENKRTYDYTIALRAVTSIDAMTADWARIPHKVLDKISKRIIKDVRHVNRVVYDITGKPPATIEWE